MGKTIKVLLMFMIIWLCQILIAEASYAISLNANNFSPDVDTKVKLEWTSVTNARYYDIERDGTTIASIDSTLVANYLNYIDYDLIPETLYNYTIRANDGVTFSTSTQGITTLKMIKPDINNVQYNVNTRDIKITFNQVSKASSATGLDVVLNSIAGIVSVVPITTNQVILNDPFIMLGTSNEYTIYTEDSIGNTSTTSDVFSIVPYSAPNITTTSGDRAAVISWAGTSNISNYVLQRAKYDGSTWGDWADISSLLTAGTTTYTDYISDDGTYKYRLSANTLSYVGYSNDGIVSVYSFPTNLKCSIPIWGSIQLDWTLGSATGSSIIVERENSAGVFFTLDTLSGTTSTYTDTYFINNSNTYTYRVSLSDGSIVVFTSNEASISTNAPAQPNNLKLNLPTNSSSSSSASIILNWEDKSNNEEGFIITRKDNNGSYQEIARVTANAITYTDATLQLGHIYYFVVNAYNSAQIPSLSGNGVKCIIPLETAIPNKINAEVVSYNQINVTWSCGEGEAYRTVLERKIDDGNWVEIFYAPEGISEYKDYGLNEDAVCSYRVRRWFNYNFYSLPFPENEADCSVVTTLRTPLNLSIWDTSNYFYLSWADLSGKETYYVVERRKETDLNFTQIAVLNADVNYFLDSGGSTSENYFYRVIARTLDNSSSYSNLISTNSGENLENIKFWGNSQTGNNVILKWQDQGASGRNYIIDKQIEGELYWSRVAYLYSGTNEYLDNIVMGGKLYNYRLTVGQNNSIIKRVNIKISTENVPTPTAIKAVLQPNGFVKLSWKDNSNNEKGFIVLKLINNKYVEIGKTPKNQNFFIDFEGSLPGYSYYKVQTIGENNSYSLVSLEAKLYIDRNDIKSSTKDNVVTIDSIKNVIAKGLINNSEFRDLDLNNGISREEFIGLVVRASGINRIPKGSFKDVRKNNKFYKEIMSAKVAGLVSGFEGKFNPNDKIKREDAFCIINKALRLNGLKLYSVTNFSIYDDKSSVSEYALKAVNEIVSQEWITKKNGKIYPQNNITMGDTLVLVDKMIRKIESGL